MSVQLPRVQACVRTCACERTNPGSRATTLSARRTRRGRRAATQAAWRQLWLWAVKGRGRGQGRREGGLGHGGRHSVRGGGEGTRSWYRPMAYNNDAATRATVFYSRFLLRFYVFISLFLRLAASGGGTGMRRRYGPWLGNRGMRRTRLLWYRGYTNHNQNSVSDRLARLLAFQHKQDYSGAMVLPRR